MVEWVESNGMFYTELSPGFVVAIVPEVKTVMGNIDFTRWESREFKTEAEAKQWCVCTARRILTEALEKLDG